ncbi:MAG: cellulose synthase complex periplasmic endoglucanase BcsZ [Mariprofundus sp.]
MASMSKFFLQVTCSACCVVTLFSVSEPLWAKPCASNSWNSYAQRFVQEDGRVVEYSQTGRTTSEGQAYALFFALIHQDRTRFDVVLKWSNNNLAGGQLGKVLPAWLWGENAQHQWGILDKNPASDADLWMAYTLIQAGRLWHDPSLGAMGDAMLDVIEKEELELLPNFGAVLLPTLKSVVAEDKQWKLNLSYTPIQIARFFSIYTGNEVWQSVVKTTTQLLTDHHKGGLVPDWLIYDREQQRIYSDRKAVMSFDAIRNYMWIGMLNPYDPLKYKLVKQLYGITIFLTDGKHLSAKIALLTTKGDGKRPIGFAVAMLPFLKSGNFTSMYQAQKNWVRKNTKKCLLGEPVRYYDNSLAMFSRSWDEHLFAFGLGGELNVLWLKN